MTKPTQGKLIDIPIGTAKPNLLVSLPSSPPTLNYYEQKILDYLKGRDFVSPTQIGHDVGGGNRHSSWASPICLRLVNKGLLLRNDKGWYRNPAR